MPFYSANLKALVEFNSSTSAEFLAAYRKHLEDKLVEDSKKTKSQNFAPSSFRCERKCWFRLRGTETDELTSPDLILDFMASVGTALHNKMQSELITMLGDSWVSVEDYLKTHPIPYEHELSVYGTETRVAITNPPIRFACDGIIEWKGKPYLLEIKTVEFSQFEDITDILPKHIDQVECYSTFLQIEDVLVVYQDRQYGGLKCFEKRIPEYTHRDVISKINRIQQYVASNIAPDKIHADDAICSYCEYKQKCKVW